MEIDNKKLIIGFSLIFLLGIAFSIVNGTYTDSTNEQLPIIVYAISFLSIIVGAFLVIMFQAKINKIQLERVLKILPREERVIVKNTSTNTKIIYVPGFII